MAAIAHDLLMSATLSRWLRLLWDMSPPLRLDSESPYISAGTIHLPARGQWRQHSAAAAHAAAHLVYSPVSFDGEGLGAIARSLVALLEDARIEALAMRELPGLARLWRPLHTATPEIGAGFEALMQRLARALADPEYDDPDPWVRKGRSLFYLDAGLELPALRTPAEVRKAATLLGHDIGQMRLPFNAKTYCPVPAYRDDHRWMWAADVLSSAPPPALVSGNSSWDDDEPAFDAEGSVSWQPEWDRLISRVRPDWCRVVERQASPVVAPISDEAACGEVRRMGLRLRSPLLTLTHASTGLRRSEEGDVFDPGALFDWGIARRLRSAGDARVYRGLDRRATHAAVSLLVDQSASTSAASKSGEPSVLQTTARSAAAAASALQAIGVASTVIGFSSNGRHAVGLVCTKSFDAPADDTMIARSLALKAGGSTRLGAALRQCTKRLVARGGGPHWVIVLSDGEPHDVDVHDPRYLVEDARHAVLDARHHAVQMACLVVGTRGVADARRIFGARRVHALQGLRHLSRAVQRLLA